jgi:nucleotide-binding universal stress UspA family protein
MYQKILVPVDGSATSTRGLQEAIKVARATGGVLRLVHVVNEYVLDDGYAPAMYYERLIESFRENGRKVIANAEEVARRGGVEFTSTMLEVVGGRASDLIVEEAKQWRAELIVMGTHGRRGLKRLALGSDAELVLRTASVPVLLVRDIPEAA